ncbi:hypothetical protein chiPu_0012010 [Chiloscyllium punctatum]|uniref:Uncharacterized protein n=1 Tax=Chiloscyllium punctatum TaxID=137246 RepID=A0A401ST22_CHIPU|nr:hypothetical protein [Chiloscyllium punctatum]
MFASGVTYVDSGVSKEASTEDLDMVGAGAEDDKRTCIVWNLSIGSKVTSCDINNVVSSAVSLEVVSSLDVDGNTFSTSVDDCLVGALCLGCLDVTMFDCAADLKNTVFFSGALLAEGDDISTAGAEADLTAIFFLVLSYIDESGSTTFAGNETTWICLARIRACLVPRLNLDLQGVGM